MNGPPSGSWRPLSELPHGLGSPRVQGVMRSRPEDFKVDEMLGFSPDGAGEHLLLKIRKRDVNTEWMARRLAAWAKVPRVDVGYAGLKDRYALTTQWFSVRLAGRPAPDWHALEGDDIRVEQVASHARKLRRGELQGNRFRIRLRGLCGRLEDLPSRLEQIRATGIPNFFGEQRFGRGYGNLEKADRLFSGSGPKVSRHKRGLYLSAVRSQMFNEVLGRRIESETWNLPLQGDLLFQEHERRLLRVEEVDPTIRQEARALRVHPSGPLWGRGDLPSAFGVKSLEQNTLAGFSGWREGLEGAGLKQARRPLRVAVHDLVWEWSGADAVELGFWLRAGSYASVVVRELIHVGHDRRTVSGA